jgi:hypothetical protein
LTNTFNDDDMVSIKLFVKKPKNSFSNMEERILREKALKQEIPKYKEMLRELKCDKPLHDAVSTKLHLYMEDQSIEFAKVCCSEFQIRIIDRIRLNTMAQA